ncbi:leucine-rich repeat-containing protein 43 isoform B [Alligator mississippiensis]|uniref:Leucine-rich repeat-containing protein 43 isoform B n=2 Tax=Alligator mississippiensis TaxID=8496 RepID=A0A151NSB3_ALLMI|nr:leucine-rich repeat-containing protein 43 isoform B [Alligator mississippiensis]
MAGLCASAAFRAHLRRLHLWEFPCGTGSWNKSWSESRKKTPHGHVAQRAAGAAPGEEADVPGEESLEALMEFVSSQGSPWALPPGCSPEDQHLKELAVQSPQLIQDSFIFLFFTSLRLVDKGVSEVDEELLKFQNLEELVLSANKISEINSANLPRTLKVLELCGNKIVALQDLCSHPPPQLQHLGLGYNLLGSSEDEHLTGQFWPNLLSLDLSFNNFTDLLGLVSKLATLRKLRVLVLQGNPLALIPGYRGLIIDSLPKLCILDDVSILPDEKHRFYGLSSQPELMVNEAQIVVTVGKIQGIPCPTTLEQLESGLDSPVIAYSYYVTYEFAEGENSKGAKSAEVPKLQESSAVATPYPKSPQRDTHEGDEVQSLLQQEMSANPANTHQTLRKPWAETVECSYRKEHVVTDLVALKGYLRAGTTVTVMEEKVLSWPVIASPVENASKKGKAEKGKQKDSAKGAKPSDKPKQKKEAPAELRSDPPILRTLGARHVKLESLLAGDKLVATVCDFGVLIPERITRPPSPKEKEGKKGKDRSKKPKPEGESTASQKPTAPAKGKGKHKESPEMKEDEETQPVPLTVEFHVQLLRWTAASDARR